MRSKMSNPRLAPCLVQLRDEVNAKWPKRSKASDGWLGDASHAARKSDHNPDSRGIVHAIDITTPNTINGRRMSRAIRDACIRDPRVWYVIRRGRIYSKTYGWKSRPYTGPNSHSTHIHISADYNRTDENDTRPFGVGNVFTRLLKRLGKR